jgi:hypothetical protein
MFIRFRKEWNFYLLHICKEFRDGWEIARKNKEESRAIPVTSLGGP